MKVIRNHDAAAYKEKLDNIKSQYQALNKSKILAKTDKRIPIALE